MAEKELCGICYVSMSNVVTTCNHQFCYTCLNEWYNINTNCPMCRNDIEICSKIS